MLGEVPSIDRPLAKPQARAFLAVVPGEALLLGDSSGEVLRDGYQDLKQCVCTLELPKTPEILDGCIYGASGLMGEHQRNGLVVSRGAGGCCFTCSRVTIETAWF